MEHDEQVSVIVEHPLGEQVDTSTEKLFEKHEVKIMETSESSWVFVFPTGTTRYEVFPRMPYTQRYTITCPDGFTVQESISIIRGERHSLSYQPEI